MIRFRLTGVGLVLLMVLAVAPARARRFVLFDVVDVNLKNISKCVCIFNFIIAFRN